jgi:anti-sigma B factor antagonist
MGMTTDIREHKGVKVVAISGEIDMASSPALRKDLMGLIGSKVPVLMVDFSGVSYIDSSGIATFVEGLKAMMPYGGKLKFLGVPEKIQEIFSFSKLDKVFEIYGNIEDAFPR